MRVLGLFFEPRYSEPTILAYFVSFKLAKMVNFMNVASIVEVVGSLLPKIQSKGCNSFSKSSIVASISLVWQFILLMIPIFPLYWESYLWYITTLLQLRNRLWLSQTLWLWAEMHFIELLVIYFIFYLFYNFSSYHIWSYFILALCRCFILNTPILPLLFSFYHTVIRFSLSSVFWDCKMCLFYIWHLRYSKPFYFCTIR